MATQNKRLKGIILTVALILLVPLIGMQFSNEVNWTISDFIIAGTLLLGAGLIVELVMRKVRKKENRNILIVIVIAALLLLWVELAVGVFGSPIAGS